MSVKRTTLQTLPHPELPGWELQLVVLDFAPGLVGPAHFHPVPGLTYVLEGTLISQFEGQDPVTYTAGDSFVDLQSTPHILAENASKDKPLKVLVSYITKTGQPYVKPLSDA